MDQGIDIKIVRRHYHALSDDEIVRVVLQGLGDLTPAAQKVVNEEAAKRKLDVIIARELAIRDNHQADPFDIKAANKRNKNNTIKAIVLLVVYHVLLFYGIYFLYNPFLTLLFVLLLYGSLLTSGFLIFKTFRSSVSILKISSERETLLSLSISSLSVLLFIISIILQLIGFPH